MPKPSADELSKRNGSYDTIAKLLPDHHLIKDLTLSGLRPGEISTKLNRPTRQIYNIVNSPSFQHELAIARSKVEANLVDTLVTASEAVTEIISAATLDAAKKLSMLINSDDETIALRSAADILDRGGYPKQTKSDNTNKTEYIIDSEAAALIAETMSLDSGAKAPVPKS